MQHITDDTDLDDCFSALAESRSNPQLLDMNVKRGPFDADVIVHFSAENNESDSLLKDKLEESNESEDYLLMNVWEQAWTWTTLKIANILI